jgi:hypothetical protein
MQELLLYVKNLNKNLVKESYKIQMIELEEKDSKEISSNK